jgi:hypothetical protein
MVIQLSTGQEADQDRRLIRIRTGRREPWPPPASERPASLQADRPTSTSAPPQ